MNSIVGTIQEIVRNEMRSVRIAELGLVEAVFPHHDSGDTDNYGCDVTLKNTGLKLKRVPVATGHIGTAAIPNVGDLVVVTFARGDINAPIIVGRMYDEADRPPLNTTDEVIFRLPLAAGDDQTIKAAIKNHQTDSPPREVILEMTPKITIDITDGTVKARAGENALTIDEPDGGTGSVTVVAGSTKITMDQDGDVQVESPQSITVKAGGEITLEAAKITLRADTDIDIQAAQINATGSGTMSLQAGGSMQIQSATISVSGVTMFGP